MRLARNGVQTIFQDGAGWVRCLSDHNDSTEPRGGPTRVDMCISKRVELKCWNGVAALNGKQPNQRIKHGPCVTIRSNGR